MKINKSKFALLGMLRYSPMSGYDIKKAIDGSIANFWAEDFGRIYPELRQMVGEGLVTRTPDIKESGPNRNIYSITDQGREAFSRWLFQPVERQPVRNELLLKIFLGGGESLGHVIQLIERDRADCLAALGRYAELENQIKEAESQYGKADLALWLVTVRNGKRKAEAELLWCDDSLQLLGGIAQDLSDDKEGI